MIWLLGLTFGVAVFGLAAAKTDRSATFWAVIILTVTALVPISAAVGAL